MIIRIAPLLNKLFFLFILVISLFPFKYGSRISAYFGEQLVNTDIFLIIMFLVLCPLYFKVRTKTIPVSITIKMFIFIVVYAFGSTLWVSYNISYWYIFYQLVLTGLTISIPYLMSKITNENHIDYNKLMSNFSIILSLIFVYYMTKMQTGGRLSGYLGGAALIPAIMFPVLAVHYHDMMHKKKFIRSLFFFIITMVAIFLTGSRVGLLSLILFAILTIFRRLSLKRFIAFVIPAAITVYVILQVVPVDRYNQGFNDTLRSTSIDTTIKWATHSVPSFLFGNGYGSIWQWYAFDKGVLPNWNFPLMSTDYGYVMFHAHSVFMQLFGELGVVGTLPFFVIIYVLIREFWKSNKTNNELRTNILGALICTLPSMHTDLYFFANWEVSIVWLFYLFATLSFHISKVTVDGISVPFDNQK